MPMCVPISLVRNLVDTHIRTVVGLNPRDSVDRSRLSLVCTDG